MINSSGCTAGGCIDARSPVPVQPGTSKLHQWAEADREFLRRLCSRDGDGDSSTQSRSPVLYSVSDMESYSVNVGRQKYLRSYRFTRKKEENIAVTVSDRIVDKWRRLVMKKSHPKKIITFSSSDIDHRRCCVFGFFFTCFTPKSRLLT